MTSSVSATQAAGPPPALDTDDRVNGELVFKKIHYDKISVNDRGAIRILKVHCASSEHDDVVCELISGTILDYNDCKNHNPPLEFKPYDALSWCWGKGPQDGKINIRLEGVSYVKCVQASVVSALRAFRHKNSDRHIWVDAICINQDYKPEKNRQVEMMADIYGRADCVRIWLGDLDNSSKLAILFIKQQVLQLQHFDDLCRSSEFSEKWKSLLELMQREWFSRRWVVQEVALAPKAIIHCGPAKLSWSKFAVAVELFVEAETATHRLSEIMKTDTKTNHVPRYFEYISQLGASLLVNATGKLFRDYDYIRRLQSEPKQEGDQQKTITKTQPDKPPEELAYESEDDEVVTPEVRAKRYKKEAQKRFKQKQETLEVMAKAQPLLTLEYLVSSLSIFDVTNPHDSVYALLGISKDTTPTAANKKLLVTDHTQSVLEMFTEKKQYNVDYTADYIDICKEFIEFCVRQNVRRDPSRALDVICRPFAVDVGQKPDGLPFPSWIPRLSKASYGMDRGPGIDGLRMGRKNADSLVGLPNITHRNYNAAETKKLEKKVFRFRKRAPPKPKDNEEESRQTITSHSVSSSATQENETRQGTTGASSSADIQEFGGPRESVEPSKASRNYSLSASSSSSATQAKNSQAIIISNSKGEKGKPTTIASPGASMDTKLVSSVSKPSSESPHSTLNHFSLFVQGFVLDTIVDLQNSSQSGSIPTAWANFAGWDMKATPPEHFWRTLVADRGSDGENPPVYYARACQECFRKGNPTSGVVDTTGLIEHERNSVVAQFCRRVQAAIWNRALVKTKARRLGLVASNVREGDLVCILYGCSVPVILRQHGPKEKEDMESEMQWELKFLANHVGERYHSRLARRELFRKKREQDKKDYKMWEDKKRKKWKEDPEWRKQWPLVQAGMISIHEFRIWAMKKRLSELGNAKDRESTKAAIESYLDVQLRKIYEIAAWAAQSGDTKENVMDRLRSSSNDESFRESFKLTEDQKKLWGLFREDTAWRDWLKKENENYHNKEGFRVWCSSVYKKPIGYADDWERAEKEWSKKAKQGSFTGTGTGLAAAKSWFLCVDSFRAWLRQRGKFCGSEELLDNKQKWEADPTRDVTEPEVKSFNAWMRKEGLENPDRQESTTNELRKRFEAWRTDWISNNPEVNFLDTLEVQKREWKKIEEDLKQKMNQEDEKREKTAQKRDKEPFLERWRMGWKPEIVNWKEFEIMLSYGRYWVKLVKRGKRDYMKGWSEPLAFTQRQLTRVDYLEKKEGRVIRYPDWSTLKGKDTEGSPNHTLPSNRAPRSQMVMGSTGANQASEGSNQTADFISQHLLQKPNSQNNSARHSEYRQEASHNQLLSVADDHILPKKPPLNRSQPDSTAKKLELAQIEELDKASKSGQLKKLDEALKSGFKSKQALKDWVEWKKSYLPLHWAATQNQIEEDLEMWLRDAPRVIGKDGKFHINYSRPSNVEKELQKEQRKMQRLEELKGQQGFEEQKKRQKVERKEEIGHGEHAEEETDTGAGGGGAEGIYGMKEDEKGKGTRTEEGHEESVRKDKEMVPGEDQKRDQKIETPKKVYVLIRETQRLTEKEKVKYTQDIEARFTTKMGKDGQWHYEMMGESYVYGMMDGEAMAHQNNEGKPTTIFEIR